MSSASNRTLPLALALAALVVAVFWPALSGELVYDDLQVVAQNPGLRDLAHLPEALTGAYWDFLDEESAARIGYWRPLTSLALFAAQQLGGGAPSVFHAFSLALHAGAAIAVFLLVRRLAGGDLPGFCAGALFALHPLHVESVAWISAISSPLQGLLVLLGLLAHLRWREAGSEGWPLVPALCLAAALMAKESAAALLPLALALDLGRRRAKRRPQPWLRAYVPLAAVGLLYVFARMAVFGDWHAGFDLVSLHLELPLARMLSLRAEFFGGALELLAWPAQLNLFREVRPVVGSFDPSVLRALVWIGLWVAAVVWAIRQRLRPGLCALLFLLASVLPVLVRLGGVGRFPLSDRFLYLSVMGAALFVTLVLFRLLPRAGAAGVATLLAVLLGLRAQSRIEVWQDELTLFRYAVAETPDSVYTRWGLGRVLLGEFQRTGDQVTLTEALDAFDHAQELIQERGPELLVTPHDTLQANLGVGWYFLLCTTSTPDRCSFEEAELVFSEVLRGFPDSELAEVGLGVSLVGLGRYDEAQEHLYRAVDQNPRLPQAWFHLGRLGALRGDWEAAASYYERALALTPNDVAALAGLGEARLNADQAAGAARVLATAHELDPDNPQVMVQLGALAGREGRMIQALSWLDRALAIDNRLGDAHLLRAKALLSQGDLDRAIPALEQACIWSPNNFEAYYNLGVILLQNGLEDQAADYLRHALSLEPHNDLAPQIRAALEAAGVR